MEQYYCNVLVAPVRANPEDQAEMVTQMLYGETCEILEREKSFAKIKMNFDGYEGWMDFKQLTVETTNIQRYIVSRNFGVFDLPEGGSLLSLGSEITTETESFVNLNDIRTSLTNMAQKFLNVPYLWGGRSFFAVDCSGFTQLLYKVHGIALPRDDYEQLEIGEPRSFIEESEPGDLAFFENEEGQVCHVGMMLSPHEIIHAHGKVRIDAIDSSGIYNAEQKRHTHKLRVIKSLL